eukprot:COSAG05_NODE_19649_length_289_cov_1.094737_1_plen_21_part_01
MACDGSLARTVICDTYNSAKG